ncbi:DUF900 domain containing protein [Sulfitobacter donghicola DSW-25 = KCTC 12864 = JCM 14565]|uniref:Esterase n=1 Tax=Sulfitobacter donghicola DSW-25 = KCTC 12864 = JCM 14565 TaxID=1300350 RepID=A0A073IEY7_9RHOB|nr:hypothetical protein DSW25_17350 [Sulfitobacter donghicola DSW-25 = KCTC 12864 = JCM 14565]KIN68748.1 DUF900 domain containing protein [Sulfitobacter donghicola DSW-25 = KCTC 12864 = JCM 14565]
MAAFAVAGCGARDQIVVVPPVEGAVQHDVLFATNRSTSARMFSEGRSQTASYGQATVSVPPKHELGVVEYPKKNANPKSEFGIIRAQTTTSLSAFEGLLETRIAQNPQEQRKAIVYVHGFNSTFAEALYLKTQLIHDYQRPEVPILFSWPSSGRGYAYLHDHESVLASRTPLETLLDTLQTSSLDAFTLVAHSMGSQLVMETLRQRSIRSNGRQWSKLTGVALISPDIDVDVFAQASKDMGGLPQPFVVIAAENDKLLSLSGVLNGSKARLGAVKTAADLEGTEATVVSADFATDLWSSNHMTAFRSPQMIGYLQAIEQNLTEQK